MTVAVITGAASGIGRAVAVEQTAMEATQFESEWSRPILFYPDGTTSDAFVVVANENKVGLKIDLRGMTGTAIVGDVIALEGDEP